ncbi:MAG: hypothetical protein HKL81_00185 [Acidimicrobiaceae bacterium]|nr:hypothetical protein [Acidimicrobiaceae bacterium]
MLSQIAESKTSSTLNFGLFSALQEGQQKGRSKSTKERTFGAGDEHGSLESRPKLCISRRLKSLIPLLCSAGMLDFDPLTQVLNL